MKNIICFSSSDWHGLWGSRQQVAQRLAQHGYRVLFVEQLAGLEHFWKYPDIRKRRLSRWKDNLQEIKPNVWLWSPPPLLPARYYHPAITQINAGIVRFFLRPTLHKLNFQHPILWLYKPEHAPFIGQFQEQAIVYHCIDEMTVGTQGRKKAIITQLEQQILQKATVVFANSKLTYQNKRPYNPHTYHFPSGADVQHFAQAHDDKQPAHPAVQSLPHPLLMYIGSVNEKIDVSLLASIARQRPQWTLVLVGQIFAGTIDLTPLQTQPNVHILGKYPFDTLPSLLRAADVCLLPYVQGEATKYRSPLKLYEYLATGKPIISTPHPEVDAFRDIVTIAPPEQFVPRIDEILQHDTIAQRAKRLVVAQQHSWDVRVTNMLQHLSPILY